MHSKCTRNAGGLGSEVTEQLTKRQADSENQPV